jgi:sterol-4alpha-carboxylate 3-dehydrogenase (decarboxylating)
VGARLVTMLLERGAERVTSVDVELPAAGSAGAAAAAAAHPRLRHAACDVSAPGAQAALAELCRGADAVFHCAALVGPGHAHAAYAAVNVRGSEAVARAAAAAGARVLVYTSSPTILLRGQSVRDASEASLLPGAPRAPREHLHEYSRTKAAGQAAALGVAARAGVRAAAIAPHQVYGPADALFLPALLAASASARLRVFGPGDNLISMAHVDNVAHAHILAARALAEGRPGVEGELFVITDTGAVYLWDAISAAGEACGLGSLHDRAHLSTAALYAGAHCAAAASAAWSALTGARPWAFSPFAVRMLLIDRWFNVDKAVARLGYRPLVAFETAWPSTVAAVWARMQRSSSSSSGGGSSSGSGGAQGPVAAKAPSAAGKRRGSSAGK